MKALNAPHCRTNPGQFGPKTFRPGTPPPQLFVFLLGFPGPGLHPLAIILILTLALASRSKGLSASTTIKRECYTLKECEGVSNLKGYQEVPQYNKLQRSITNKSTAREYNNKKNACDYHNQKYCKGVRQSKELPGITQFKGLPRSIIIKTTTGECQNQNYCQEGPQSKGLLGSATNKITLK